MHHTIAGTRTWVIELKSRFVKDIVFLRAFRREFPLVSCLAGEEYSELSVPVIWQWIVLSSEVYLSDVLAEGVVKLSPQEHFNTLQCNVKIVMNIK